MLSILFFILKVILILLLCLLGLVVLLALVILFVPIRYKIWFQKTDDVQARITVTWLLRIVLAKAYYLDKKFRAVVRIFGYPVFDTLKPKKEKKDKKKPAKKIKTKSAKSKQGKKEKASESVQTKQEKVKTVISTIEIKQEPKEPLPSEPKTDTEQQLRVDAQQPVMEKNPVSLEELQSIDKSQNEESTENKTDSKIEAFFHKIGGGLRKICDKILHLKEKIKNIFTKIKNTFVKIKETFSRFLAKIKGIKDKKDKLLAFWHEDTNRQGLTKAFVSLVQILKEIGPDQIQGQIIFGTGDPCSTGQALGAAAFFYGMYGQSIQIIPDFEKQVFQADVTVKGRIRIIRLLIIGIRMIRDQNFKGLLKNVKQLKEEL